MQMMLLVSKHLPISLQSSQQVAMQGMSTIVSFRCSMGRWSCNHKVVVIHAEYHTRIWAVLDAKHIFVSSISGCDGGCVKVLADGGKGVLWPDVCSHVSRG